MGARHTRTARTPAGVRAGSTSAASTPSRAARKRFFVEHLGRVHERGVGVTVDELEAHEALRERDERRRRAERRLRVHDPRVRADARPMSRLAPRQLAHRAVHVLVALTRRDPHLATPRS
jgi:hypothetical protein